MLEAWLEFHRATLQLKCQGLDAERLAARPVPTSALSLHGLVRHLADVERGWFTRTLLRAPDTPPLFYDPAVEDSGMVPLDGRRPRRRPHRLAGGVRAQPATRRAVRPRRRRPA